MWHLLGFIILSFVKIFSHLFYSAEFVWKTDKPKDVWRQTRIIALLNHTSLFEPLYIRAFSFADLWYLTARLNVPGADITLRRPLVGLFWKLMFPNIISVSRKQDSTWSTYLKSIRGDSIILMAPEGRMKRPNGLDKYGKPMTVKPGIVDIIEASSGGGMVLALSGGLHHIQRPGEPLPKFFKSMKMNLYYFDLDEYKKRFPGSSRERKLAMVADLQHHLETNCPASLCDHASQITVE
jgi:hypothetical protein